MTMAVSTAYLDRIMRDSRARTIELIDGLDSGQLIGPKLDIVNPLLWEIGHVAWFHEFFILRSTHGQPPILADGDGIYDSIAIAHATRWDLPLLTLEETTAYLERVLEALLARLDGDMAGERDSYLYQFTTFHEDMHTEAYTYSRQTLGYPEPAFAVAGLDGDEDAGPLPGDVDVPGGTFTMGAARDSAFHFDNEQWAHAVEIAPFQIARAPVTNAEFAAFVEEGGYARREFWDGDGWRWRQDSGADRPLYWEGGSPWQVRRFDRVIDLPASQPVIFVNWYEANAWCRWAGRRLPSESEWDAAALGEAADGGGLSPTRRPYPWGTGEPEAIRANLDGRALGCIDVAARPAGDSTLGCRQMIGNVWEWTATAFHAFPGFTPGAYKEYSEPLFGSTRVLKGGAWPTRSRLINGAYRNFYTPERRDVFAGFRTCAL